MNKTKSKYREVDALPPGSVRVAVYATANNFTTPYIYKLWKQHLEKGKTIPFEIVSFMDINFVVPAS